MKRSITSKTDGYKFGHWKFLPPKTEFLTSYIESRGGEYSDLLYLGMQGVIKKDLLEPFPNGVTDIHRTNQMCKAYGLDFNLNGFLRLFEKHGNKLPIEIRSAPEGSVIPVKNVLATITNTDPEFPWLTNFLETLLLRGIWYPTTVGTKSRVSKIIIRDALLKSADNLDGLPFKLHDFGQRGVSSEESAGIGGLAHLVNFLGSDTFDAIEYGMEYYNVKDMAAFSIHASEHSIHTSWTEEKEYESFKHMSDTLPDGTMFSCVIDSYDTFRAIEYWGRLKHQLEAKNQTLVLRPDSGDPVEISLAVVKKADEVFGSHYNKKSFKELNGVKVIYGDGISSPEVIREILNNLMNAGYSADIMAFGMGGGLLQKCDRDTMRFAMKCSAITSEGKVIPVFKNPKTDKGKASKKGFLDLQKDVKGNYHTVSSMVMGEGMGSCLRTVFKDGELLIDEDLETIRERAQV